jgi:hypothetical protein
VRHLQQHAGAVAGVRFGAARAAVVEVRQNLQALLKNLVRFAALGIHDKADAAGIVLIRRVVQPLLFGSGGPQGTAPFSSSRAHVGLPLSSSNLH